MTGKISLRIELFLAILAVALSCVLASALLSNYLANRQISKFVDEHREVLLPPESDEDLNRFYGVPGRAVPNEGTRDISDPDAINPAAPRQAQPRQKPRVPPRPSNINLSFILAGALGVVLAFLGSLFIAGRISRPLSGLTEATRKIAGGDYDERVEVSGGREVEELGDAFNSLAAGLEKNEELRRNMVADISHELRNPLATLRAQLELMQDGTIECDREAVDSLLDDAMVLTHVVDDLRQLSEVDAGTTGFEVRPVDVAQVVSDVRSRFEREAASRKIALTGDVEAGLLPALADPMRLSQVLANLVINALKNTPEGGCVTVRAARSAGEILFTVRDNGSGIPPSELPLVFERFYRTDKSRTRATGGAGLGLSIARSFVEAMGGRIWAESDGETGASFHFTLPLFSV